MSAFSANERNAAVSAERILALDVGTQSVRAIAFDPRGEPVAIERLPITPYVSPRPGWAEQDPELYWRSIGEATRRLWSGGDVRPDEIAGLTLTTQRATVVCADAGGRPLRPAIVWLDGRRTPDPPMPGFPYDLAFRLLRVSDTVRGLAADTDANWIARSEPDVWAATARYGLLSAWLTWRLVGRWIDSVACQVGHLPFDFKAQRWARKGGWQWQVSPIRADQLPTLVPPGDVLGELSPTAADHLGLPAGLPLIAAAGDKQAEAIGVGALDPSIGAISYGTTATFATTHARYVEAIPLVPPYPAGIAGRYSLELQVYRGYWLVDWFRRELGLAELRRAAEAGTEPEMLFDELLASTPPGAMGLILQPTWTQGVRVPGPEAKGAIIGWGDVHTRAHLYRAILEGIAYALREGLERTEQRARVTVGELRVSGGGSRSRGALRLTADIFGLPVGRPATSETAGLGAAVVASVGLGIHSDVETAVAEMTHIAERIDPDPTTHALYDELYRSVYRRIYPRLRPLYEEIRRITRYPS
jgi:sugar (pentulose or hexulose) kinase